MMFFNGPDFYTVKFEDNKVHLELFSCCCCWNWICRLMVSPGEMSSFLSLSGVSAVEAEWVPQLLPQYCHFGSPLESPSPWFCSSTGAIRCHRSSTFCKFSTAEHRDCVCAEKYLCRHSCNCLVSPAVRVGWQLPAVEKEYPDGLERYKLFARFLLEGQVLQRNPNVPISVQQSLKFEPYFSVQITARGQNKSDNKCW